MTGRIARANLLPMTTTTEGPPIAPVLTMPPRGVRGVDLFWMLGAPIGIVALLFAFGAHF
jgi:hypothetical protein